MLVIRPFVFPYILFSGSIAREGRRATFFYCCPCGRCGRSVAFFTAVVAGTAYWEILLSAKRVEPVILNDFMHGQASLFL